MNAKVSDFPVLLHYGCRISVVPFGAFGYGPLAGYVRYSCTACNDLVATERDLRISRTVWTLSG